MIKHIYIRNNYGKRQERHFTCIAASNEGSACSRFLWASAANSCVSSDFFLAATSFLRNALLAWGGETRHFVKRGERGSLIPCKKINMHSLPSLRGKICENTDLNNPMTSKSGKNWKKLRKLSLLFRRSCKFLVRSNKKIFSSVYSIKRSQWLG